MSRNQRRWIVFVTLISTLIGIKQVFSDSTICHPNPSFSEYGYSMEPAGSYCIPFDVSTQMKKYLHIINIGNSTTFTLKWMDHSTDTSYIIPFKLDLLSRKYFTVTELPSFIPPTSSQDHCSGQCPLIFESTGTWEIWYTDLLNSNEKIRGTLDKLSKKRYGYIAKHSDMPIRVEMIPKRKYKKMDLDLRGYTELLSTSSGGYFYPNNNDRNYRHNYKEHLDIIQHRKYDYINHIQNIENYQYIHNISNDNENERQQPKKPSNILYIFEVYASSDTNFNVNYYSLEVHRNFFEIDWIRIVFIALLSLIVVLLITLLILIFYRERSRILFRLGFRSTPHSNGATKKQMKKSLKKTTFKQWKKEQNIDVVNNNEHHHSKKKNNNNHQHRRRPISNQISPNVNHDQNKYAKDTEEIEMEGREFDSSNSSSSEDSNDQMKCAICLCGFEDDEQIGITKCQHIFHMDCLKEWLEINKVCPLCLQDVTEAVDQHGHGHDQQFHEENANPENIVVISSALDSSRYQEDQISLVSPSSQHIP